jgi:hypothetical protein
MARTMDCSSVDTKNQEWLIILSCDCSKMKGPLQCHLPYVAPIAFYLWLHQPRAEAHASQLYFTAIKERRPNVSRDRDRTSIRCCIRSSHLGPFLLQAPSFALPLCIVCNHGRPDSVSLGRGLTCQVYHDGVQELLTRGLG